MITCKQSLREKSSNINLKAGNFTIKQSDKVKILGVFLTRGMDQTPNIINVIS